ncbi:MAG: transposase [Elusimicrobia bacterium]|nr:transposase [Elusimicrobiota bacterium]
MPDLPHHVTQRGNNKENVFLDDQDRRFYLGGLKECSQKFGLKIWAYCLMTNHVHFIVVPENQNSIAKTMASLHATYALYFNAKAKRSGHLWQGRFFSSVLDEQYTYAAVRYVERNPVRAGLVIKAEEYFWSSAKAHISKIPNPILSYCPLLEEIPNWSDYLTDEEDARFLSGIRHATHRGRPTGKEEFISRMEQVLQKDLTPKIRGRPVLINRDRHYLFSNK